MKDLIKILDVLSDQHMRLKCGIDAENKFLFASTGGSINHAQGYNCIRKVTADAGVTTNLTATKMRHRAATVFAGIEMPESERLLFYNHMGHSEDVNKNVYQCPPALKELTQVESYLSSLDESRESGPTANQRKPRAPQVS